MSSIADPTSRRRLPLIAAILAIAATAGGGAWWRYSHTYHFAVVQAGALYRDGNHSIAEFAAAARKAVPRTIVSLVDDTEMAKPQFQQEVEFCRARGIDLVRIPIKLGGWPTGQQVDQFLRIAGDPRRQPVLVHCAQGVRRTGMMAAAYQESILGYDAAKTRQSILSFGHSEHTIADVQKFVDAYDPKARTLTATMPSTANE